MGNLQMMFILGKLLKVQSGLSLASGYVLEKANVQIEIA